MGRAILEFDLNNPDDKIEFIRATRATDMALLLWDFARKTKKETEREFEANTMINEDKIVGAEMVFQKFYELLEYYKLDIDELVD